MKFPKDVNGDEHDDAVPAEFEQLLQQCGTREHATVLGTLLVASLTKSMDPFIRSYWDYAALPLVECWPDRIQDRVGQPQCLQERMWCGRRWLTP